MVLLAALLCNYRRGKCLIDIGTEGNGRRVVAEALQLEGFDPQSDRYLTRPATLE